MHTNMIMCVDRLLLFLGASLGAETRSFGAEDIDFGAECVMFGAEWHPDRSRMASRSEPNTIYFWPSVFQFGAEVQHIRSRMFCTSAPRAVSSAPNVLISAPNVFQFGAEYALLRLRMYFTSALNSGCFGAESLSGRRRMKQRRYRPTYVLGADRIDIRLRWNISSGPNEAPSGPK